MELLLEALEWIGTIAFSISGAITGLKNKMDLFGVAALGVITATGGGILRDIMMGKIPPRVFENPYVLLAALVAALAIFFGARSNRIPNLKLEKTVLFAADTLGLSAFTVIGIQYGIQANIQSFSLLLTLGVLTAVGGGIVRDVCAGNVPDIFLKHIYALASVAGAAAYILTYRFWSTAAATVTALIFIILIRILAMVFRWDLPKSRL